MLALMASAVVLLVFGPLLLIAVAGLLLVIAAIFPSSGRRLRETFRCPWTRRVVTVDFLVLEGAAHPSGVASCTAFRSPERLTCKKGCQEFADVRWGQSRGVFPRWALTADGMVTWRSVAESGTGGSSSSGGTLAA